MTGLKTYEVPIKTLDHITLPVGELDTADAFYVDILGATLLERFDRELFLRYRPGREDELAGPNSPLHLSLQLGAGPRLDLFVQEGGQPAIPRANPHVAFEVEADALDPAIASLESPLGDP